MARALCDTGTQPNIVMHKLVKIFYDKTSSVQTTINGVTSDSVQIKREIVLTIKPWFDSEDSITTTFLIFPQSCKWNPVLPNTDVHCDFMGVGLPAQLADPMFWKSAPIHMLCGVEIWARMVPSKNFAMPGIPKYDSWRTHFWKGWCNREPECRATHLSAINFNVSRETLARRRWSLYRCHTNKTKYNGYW